MKVSSSGTMVVANDSTPHSDNSAIRTKAVCFRLFREPVNLKLEIFGYNCGTDILEQNVLLCIASLHPGV